MAVPYPQVVLFGDSLFQGAAKTADGFSFQGALQDQCMRRFDVVNRGFSGYNTSNALKALPQIFAMPTEGGPKLRYLFILLGANDASLKRSVDNQHVPRPKFKENLTRIITHPNITAHKPKIFLITPPPLDEMRMKVVDLENGYHDVSRKAKISASYSEAVREVAAENPGVTLIDLWKALMAAAIEKTPGFDPAVAVLGDPESEVRGYLEQLLPDGLHMSAEAYRIFYDMVQPHLGSEWADTREEDKVGYLLPDWRDAPWLEEGIQS
ncbi:SGNH hydrolase-type esterase domain-containing protein [Apodospora peruviana]|uniref:SGNH hydrolase-type esterase domain-containing protein n=1 Tax=Apodospora peruviana TaxID=516989 RepID=A0AAE0M7K1_9PEZI|nr:SGNH hydrolase-type esterase domain-containing protein [Apodospora peruviana]